MATYDYNNDQLGDVIESGGGFWSTDRDEILQALQQAGIFAGGDANVEVLGGDDQPTSGDDVAYYTEAPDHPVTLDPSVGAYIFDTNDEVDATLNGSGSEVIVTGGGDDAITSNGSSSDFIYAGDGDNTVSAGAGNDTVVGGDGNDNVATGSGNDTIVVSGGDNAVDGGSGNDQVLAGDGNDTVMGGAG